MKYLLVLLLVSFPVMAQNAPEQFGPEKYLNSKNSYDNRWWESEVISGTSRTKIYLDRSTNCKFYSFPTNAYALSRTLSEDEVPPPAEIYVLTPRIAKDRMPDCSGANAVLVNE